MDDESVSIITTPYVTMTDTTMTDVAMADVVMADTTIIDTPRDLPVTIAGESPYVHVPQLPVELWAEVFRHLDEFSLWVDCRKVSQTFRAVAEREVAKARLPRLGIKWECRLDEKDGAEAWNPTSVLTLGRFLRFDETCDRAVFALHRSGQLAELQSLLEHHPMRARISDTQISVDQVVPPRQLVALGERTWNRMVTSTDADYKLRLERDISEPHIHMWAQLGPFMNDASLPGARFHGRGEISFQWKVYLDGFFKDADYVRRHCLPKHANGQLESQSIIESLKRSFSTSISELGSETISSNRFVYMSLWASTFGQNEELYYQQAYIHRLSVFHSNLGIDMNIEDEFGTEERFQDAVFGRVRNMRYRRNIQVLNEYEKALN